MAHTHVTDIRQYQRRVIQSNVVASEANSQEPTGAGFVFVILGPVQTPNFSWAESNSN